MRRKLYKPQEAALIDRTTTRVRFSEVDSMTIVWHGSYIHYFEDGRESFGRKYGLGYMTIYENGYVTPIVDLNCQYKSSLRVGEEAIIETRYIPTSAAKIVFEYIIYKADGETIVATGSTVQVFLNTKENNQLELNNPDFYLKWKKQWNII